MRSWGAAAGPIAVLATLAVAVVVVATALPGYRQAGPLQASGGAGVRWPPAGDAPFTWAMGLPDNHSDAPIEIESIVPVGVRGLAVIGVLVSYDGCPIPVISFTYPPVGVSARSPEGAISGAGSGPCALTALIGVRRANPGLGGRIEALRVRYRWKGRAYETVFPWILDVPPRRLEAVEPPG